ncbi:MAG: catalase [Planctomycetota bacterium]
MEGFGVHTYKLINAQGKEVYVKFHWLPTCGVRCLTDDQAVVVGGKDHSHATRDLTEAIDKGEFPEWKLFIQTMEIQGKVGHRAVPLLRAPCPMFSFHSHKDDVHELLQMSTTTNSTPWM